MSTENDAAEDEASGTLALGQRLVANAMRYRSSKAEDTDRLRLLAHDAHLVPEITDRIELLLAGLHRDTNATYDIQGMSDAGSDVLVRLRVANGVSFIGIQVKSHREIAETKELIKELRAQLSMSEDHYGPLLHWYVFLSADVSDPNDRMIKRRIRSIYAAMSKKTRVTVVGPQYAVTFLRLRKPQLDSLTTLTLRTGDPMVEDAAADLDRHPLDAAILLRVISESVTSQAPEIDLKWLRGDSYIREVAANVRLAVEKVREDGFDDYEFDLRYLDRDQLSDILRVDTDRPPANSEILEAELPRALERLEDDFVIEGDLVSIPISAHAALYGLAAEGVVRHGLDGNELPEYLVGVVL